MLLELHLRNLAVAADVSIELGPGLNVLTGRTGAGKSLVVEALRWLRGDDVDRGILRAGAEVASAEALFDLGCRPHWKLALAELGVDPPSDGILRLRREVRREGRTRAFVGARPSSAAVLQSLCELLVEMQSQHEQLSLRQPTAHAGVLDELGALDERARWNEAFTTWRAVEQRIARAHARTEQLREQRDLLEFQRRELEQARLEGDELEPLRARVARLEGGARLIEGAQAAFDALDAENGATSSLAEALHQLRVVPEELTELLEARDGLHAAVELVEETKRSLERFLDAREFDPASLARDQERLAEITALVRKYGRTEAELVQLRDRLRTELAGLDEEGELPSELAREREGALIELQAAADTLEQARSRTARRVERTATPLLAELGMPGAALRFDLLSEDDGEGPIRVGGRRVRPLATGPTAVRLSVRTNAGERFGALERVASGGELSRIGLVLRSLGSATRRPALLLLDEVDAGLGADLGPALARRLRALAESGQVLVISHLPAVAAAADAHLVAQKADDGTRTESRIDVLDPDARISELARMLGAEEGQGTALARDLLRHRGDLPALPRSQESAS